MQCVIKEIQKTQIFSMGAPKEILVDEFEWVNHGQKGRTFTYRMSQERFDRTNQTAYQVWFEFSEPANGESPLLLATISFYDLVDYDLDDCIGDQLVEQAANKMQRDPEEVWKLLKETFAPIIEKVQKEFEQTKEYQVSQKNQQITSQYKENKKKFAREWGVDAAEYDRCYNVFGELMDATYLNHLQEKVAEREKFSETSRKKHKQAWRNFSSSNDFFRAHHNANPEEQEMLSKFYKVLAKKYHPDANPGIDTSKEMQLLNQLKKEWQI